MQVELDLVKELSVVYDSVKQGYMIKRCVS